LPLFCFLMGRFYASSLDGQTAAIKIDVVPFSSWASLKLGILLSLPPRFYSDFQEEPTVRNHEMNQPGCVLHRTQNSYNLCNLIKM